MLVLTVFAFLLVQINAEFACPSFCNCRQSTIINCEASGVSNDDLDNLFRSLPREVRYFKLTKSNLSTIDTSLFSRVLPNLQQLSLEANQLNAVPKNLSGVFPALNNLNLVKNQISEIIASDFAGLKDLTKLNLDGNKLTSIGANAFASNAQLKQIFATENLIENISPDAFNGLEGLSLLSLRANKLKTLQTGVLKSLENGQIMLQENLIENIGVGLFKAGQKVRMIDFRQNKITNIDPKAFDQVTIDFLNVGRNQLKGVPSTLYESLNLLDMSDNPLDCECGMAKLIEAAAAKDKLQKLGGACLTPESLKGTELKSMDPTTVINDLGCTICDLNNTCLNAASCVPVSATELSCECTEGFTGDLCQDKVTTTTTTTVTSTTITPAPTPAPAPKSDDTGKDDGTTMYIIIAVIVLVILIIAAIVICICIRKRRNQPAADANDTLLKPQSTTKDVAEKA